MTTVIVDGVTVVENGKVLTMDYAAAAAELEDAQRRAEPKVKALDWAGRDHLTICRSPSRMAGNGEADRTRPLDPGKTSLTIS